MTKKPRKKKKNGKRNKQIFLIAGLFMATVFLPSTLLLCIGMLPTFVAVFIDPTRRKTKSITVGALNLTGCTPFLLKLWGQDHSFESSISIITDPLVISIMYGAAAMGYLVDWALAGIVAGLLYQRGLARKKAIKERQAALVERWGKEVTGQTALNEEGFPLQMDSKS